MRERFLRKGGRGVLDLEGQGEGKEGQRALAGVDGE